MVSIALCKMLIRTSELIVDTSDTKILEDFWEEHKSRDLSNDKETDSLLDSPSSLRNKPVRGAPGQPKGHGRNRSASDGTTLLPAGQTLSSYHPAWSLPRLLETFGPLIFPIYRAALLRKRILITAHAPVEETCNFGKYPHPPVHVSILIIRSIRPFRSLQHTSRCLRHSFFQCSTSKTSTPLLNRRP